MAEKKGALIDPIYERFVRGVTRAIGSTDFYEFFMDAISHAENEFQFSNRKMVKTIDLTWVDAIEESLEAMQTIVSLPRCVIKEEDLIVNVANAKRSGAETVRHLAQHSALVDSFNEETGDVKPGKLLQRFREETTSLYENRLVFTTMEMAYHFVKIRYDALSEAMSDEFGAKLKVKSDMDSATEHVHLDMFLHIKEVESAIDADKKNEDTLSRISRMHRLLSSFMRSEFAQELAKMNRVKGTINKTNVLKKNKNYKAVVKLLEFLRNYDDVGYTIKIVEQSPEINERFEGDIYRNILFNYLILKGYLEDEEDRTVPTAPRTRKKNLKPKFIHQIVEELTEDYDLPDVEIRKVLIEELTKEQLMQEEAAERRRLVEEQARKKKEEEERIRAEKKAEQERLKAERAAERERIRQEKEAEEMRRRQEQMERESADRQRRKRFQAELSYFREKLGEKLEARAAQKQERETLVGKEDYNEAVRLLEEEDIRRKEEAEREKRRNREERERILAEKRAAERKLRAEQEAARARYMEEQKAEEARREEEKKQELRIYYAPLLTELQAFTDGLAKRRDARESYQAELAGQKEQHRAEVRARHSEKM